MVLVSAVTCLAVLHNLGSVGIGTIIAAVLAGTVVGIITKAFGKQRDKILGKTDEDLRFSSESGSFVGRVVGNQMRFTREGDSTVYYVDKPNTQEVLEGKGAFDRGNGVEKAIEAQLCAAFNRGVATEPDKWYTPSQYYKNSVANFYAGFFLSLIHI